MATADVSVSTAISAIESIEWSRPHARRAVPRVNGRGFYIAPDLPDAIRGLVR